MKVQKKSLVTTFLIFSCCISCQEKNDPYEDVIEALRGLNKLNITDDIVKIFVLTENECLTCNKEFGELMEKNLEDKSSLFIINASGLLVDTSGFKATDKNVIKINSKNPFFQNTKAIIINNKRIDTILNINLKQKTSQFDYINSL